MMNIYFIFIALPLSKNRDENKKIEPIFCACTEKNVPSQSNKEICYNEENTYYYCYLHLILHLGYGPGNPETNGRREPCNRLDIRQSEQSPNCTSHSWIKPGGKQSRIIPCRQLNDADRHNG